MRKIGLIGDSEGYRPEERPLREKLRLAREALERPLVNPEDIQDPSNPSFMPTLRGVGNIAEAIGVMSPNPVKVGEDLQGNPRYIDPTMGMATIKRANLANKVVKGAEEALDMSYAARMERAKEMGFNPDTWYHGSFHDIKSFDPKKGNPEGYLGKSIYMTNNPEDAYIHYSKKSAPDVTQKIEREHLGRGTSLREATNKVLGNPYREEGAIYPLKERTKKTLNLTPDDPTYIDFTPKYNKDGDIVKENKNVTKIYEALKEAAEKYEDVNVDKTMTELTDLLYDQTRATDLHRALINSEGIGGARNGGELVSRDIIREIYKKLGYDSALIDAKHTFPNMKNTPEGTQHLMIFDPKLIRSENAAFDPKKKNSRNILASILAGFGGKLIGGQEDERPNN